MQHKKKTWTRSTGLSFKKYHV